jgi:hypothetical protein
MNPSLSAGWVFQIAKMNEGVVSKRKTLAALLSEKDPVSVTKKGEIYHFDPTVIATLGKALQEDLQRRFWLPVLFYSSPDVPDCTQATDSIPDECTKHILLASPGYLRLASFRLFNQDQVMVPCSRTVLNPAYHLALLK